MNELKAKAQYFYGIRFVWHGPWSDPEVIWHGKSFNYYSLETPLWEMYSEWADENQIDRTNDDEEFKAWVKKNAYLARECLMNLSAIDCLVD